MTSLPEVLDVCCGTRAFWFDAENPVALFLDKRSANYVVTDSSNPTGTRRLSVRPDMQADFTSLPFRDQSFSLVVFDPPHYKNIGNTGWLARRYGKLTGNWEDMLRAGFSECFRVLKPSGVLVFKWCAVDIPISRILRLTEKKPLFGNRCGKRSRTHWVVFMKLTQEDHA